MSNHNDEYDDTDHLQKAFERREDASSQDDDNFDAIREERVMNQSYAEELLCRLIRNEFDRLVPGTPEAWFGDQKEVIKMAEQLNKKLKSEKLTETISQMKEDSDE